MDYQTFKDRIQEELWDFYGQDAKVRIVDVLKPNGIGREGICVETRENGMQASVSPILPLEMLYGYYSSGKMSLSRCVGMIVDTKQKMDIDSEMKVASCIINWGFSKFHVYPAVCRTEGNEEMLAELAHGQMLDLSYYYIVKTVTDSGVSVAARVTKDLMEGYGISEGELSRQAFENMKRDGYKVQPIGEMLLQRLIKSLFMEISVDESVDGDDEDALMPCAANCSCPLLEKVKKYDGEELETETLYIVTNKDKFFGAAAILDKDLIRKLSGGRNLYIIPSSVHEILVMVENEMQTQEMYDQCVREVNEKLLKEDVLEEHAYYYDAAKDEIRIHI